MTTKFNRSRRVAWHPAELVTLVMFACFLAALIFWS